MNCPPPETWAPLADAPDGPGLDPLHRIHLDGCSACREKAARLARVAATLRGQPSPPMDHAFVGSVMARVAVRREAPRARNLGLAAFAACAAALLFMVVLPRTSPYTARGGAGNAPSRQLGMIAYRHPASHPGGREALHPHDRLQPGDGLSFELLNLSQEQPYYLLFAIDAARELHWFYPAFLDAAQDPVSPQLPARTRALSLAEGVTPEGVASGPGKIVAVFSRSPLHVKDIEQRLARGDLAQLGAGPWPVIESLEVEFERVP